MILYLSIILASMIIVGGLNIGFCLDSIHATTGDVIGIIFQCVLLEIIIAGACATLVHFSPEKWYAGDKKFFRASKKELKLYNFLRVKNWKTKVMELGICGGFSKRKIADPKNPEYIHKYLVEINRGILAHRLGAICSFALLLIMPSQFALTLCLPIAIVSAVLNILPIMVLKYNQPKILAIYRLLEKKAKNKQNAITHCEEEHVLENI